MDPSLAVKLLIWTVVITDFRLPLHQQPLQTAAVAAVWDSSHLPSAPSHRFVVTTSAPVDNDVTIASKDCSDRGDGQPVTSQKTHDDPVDVFGRHHLGGHLRLWRPPLSEDRQTSSDLPPGIILAT
ncbi:hypothetical protein C0Q70_04578 [Pomacea canaliculata]|uniref:Uncharacterized protein n=1 Tax=Pomacea canaliculata TaxID=400727 RepID=A0A2T7PIT5_POMCA|nr:hypothetical protein C0Q70_04578 [Pomacea canaliculata]